MYFGTSVEENTLNIFLEYVPGGSIASLLQKFGKFSEPVIQVRAPGRTVRACASNSSSLLGVH